MLRLSSLLARGGNAAMKSVTRLGTRRALVLSDQLSCKLSTHSENEKFVVKSPFEDAIISETNFYSHVFQHFPKYGNKTALVDGITGREYSYTELQESAVKMASGLVNSGLEQGDVLALVSPNSVEFSITYFSTLAMGGVVSTCNPQYTADELAYQFKDSNTKYVATVPALLSTVQRAASKSGCVKKIIVIADDGGIGEGKELISYQQLLQDTGSRFPSKVELDAKTDVAVLPYSSGTTGLPKGVMLTHHNLSANVSQVTHPQFLDFTSPDSCALCVLPFFHIYGMVTILCVSLYQGTKLVILPKFEPESFLDSLQKFSVTDTFIVPPLALFLAKHPLVDKYNITSLRHMMSAAAPLDKDTAFQARDRIGAKVIRQGYGLTELSPISHLCPIDNASDAQTIGVPVLSTEVKTVDRDTGRALGPHCQGEIAVKGPQVMKGYFNKHKATDETVTENGWLMTGDVGYYDENGYFYITDRLKELIKVKGFQVAPAELEGLLLQHPHISDAAVIGVADERSGELPRAFVVRSSEGLSVQQVEDYVKGQVSEHKWLKGGVKFVNEIPKSASGKILRRMLRNN